MKNEKLTAAHSSMLIAGSQLNTKFLNMKRFAAILVSALALLLMVFIILFGTI